MWLFPKLAEWQVVQDILRIINPDYISPVGREERSQKAIGYPAERQAEQRRIAREEALYRHGMPVAGHNEPVPKNNPKLRRKHPFVP